MTDPQSDIARIIPRLVRLSRILAPSRESAEDLAQETLLRVWSRLRGGAEIEDLEAYLMTTLRHLARRKTRPMLPLDDDMAAQNAGVLDRLELGEVLAALDRLPQHQARLVRAFAMGHSLAEIARAEGVPQGTVMSRIARARTQLRARLRPPADPPPPCRGDAPS